MTANVSLEDRATGCLLGGLLGDAMGSLSEGLSAEQVEERFGWLDNLPEGSAGTDDTFLRDMLSAVLVGTNGYARSADWAAEWAKQASLVLSTPLRQKFFISILQTTQKLRLGVEAPIASVGNLPSSTAAMAIAPVGVVNSGHPKAAASQAYELATLVHPAEVAFCREAAATVAGAVAGAIAGMDVRAAIDAGLSALGLRSGESELACLVQAAVGLADESQKFADFRSAYMGRFQKALQCDARETVPAALAISVLALGDPATAISYAANFGRDTDTIGSMAGSLCGAIRGVGGLPERWLGQLGDGIEQGQRDLAADLLGVYERKADREVNAWRAARTA